MLPAWTRANSAADHSEIDFVFVPPLLSSAPGPQMERAMEKGAADFAIQFSTDAVPARERLSYFREHLAARSRGLILDHTTIARCGMKPRRTGLTASA